MSNTSSNLRFFWIDIIFFYSCFLTAFTPKIFNTAYLGLAFIYPIIFVFLSYRFQKEKSNIQINLLRIPFIWAFSASTLAFMYAWTGAVDLFVYTYATMPIFFVFFMIHELLKRKTLGRFVSIPLAIGASLLIIGILFMKQSYAGGRPIFWTGVGTTIFTLLLSIWSVLKKEQYSLPYLAISAFLLIYILLTRPWVTVSAAAIEAFFKLNPQ